MTMVTQEYQESICILTINRPKQLNALNSEVLQKLGERLDSVDLNTTRCIIITGSGHKAFAAGADIAEMHGMSQRQATAFSMKGNHIFQKLEEFPLPVIAAVNGYALGGGCELALSCDLRVASTNALFGQPETTLGITPGFGGTQRLPRLIGITRAKELIYTARNIRAEEALAMGLVNKVVDLEDLLSEAIGLAQRIADNAPIAVQLAKSAINRGLQGDIYSGVSIEADLFGQCIPTEDCRQAMQSFLEKIEKPKFHNT